MLIYVSDRLIPAFKKGGEESLWLLQKFQKEEY